jgi:hypothetical protein
MSRNAVAQEPGSTAEHVPRPTRRPHLATSCVPQRIATDSASLDGDTRSGRFRLTACRPPRIDAGTRPTAFRYIVRTDP